MAKKVIKKSEEELAGESKTEEKAAVEKVAAAPAAESSRKVVRGQAHIKASYNNTVLAITDMNGNVLAWSTSGALGFKGAKKATPYAATKIAETVIEKIKKTGISEVSVFVKGIGGGREAAVRALANKGLNIVSIKDVTPLPHNGCKPPKVRRI